MLLFLQNILQLSNNLESASKLHAIVAAVWAANFSANFICKSELVVKLLTFCFHNLIIL